MITTLFFIPAVMLFFLITLSLIDILKKRKKFSEYPRISFIIPAYNCEGHIEKTIRSIYASYPKDKINLYVVNDNSKDSTLQILKGLKKKFKFYLTNQIENLGKTESINRASKLVKDKFIFIVDSDMILNKRGIDDIITRFENNSNLGGVSCRYSEVSNRFFRVLQDFEYSMLSLFLLSFNSYSTISLFGGCIAVRKKALNEVRGFTLNAAAEDIDMALKLKKFGWKVEQSPIAFQTQAMDTFKRWANQKIRWSTGVMQCFIKYGKDVYLKNPIVLLYVCISLFSIYFSIQNILLLRNSQVESSFFDWIGEKILFSVFVLPYALISIRKPTEIFKIFLIFPYALCYIPLRFILMLVGFSKGIYRHFTLGDNQRGW